MHGFKTVSAALALCVLPMAAQAGSVQAPQNYFGGNITNIGGMSMTPGSGGSAGFSGMTGNVHVQTNIDNTKVINSSSNVSVNTTINGSNVAYGLDGANALNVINNNSSYDASVSAMFTGTAENLENEALAVATAMQ